MLHRVVDKKDYTKIGIDGLEISREFLESLIQYFLSNNYEIVSIDNVYDILKGGRPLEKRFVHFTFDDGFRDNYTIVYPVFKKYGIPFTVYINPSIIDGKLPVWWFCLGDVIIVKDYLAFRVEGVEYEFDLKTRLKKETAFKKIHRLINEQPYEKYLPTIEHIFRQCGMDIYKYSKKIVLTWKQIKEFCRDPLVVVGSHGLHHYQYSQLTQQQVKDEVEYANRLIQERTGQKTEHFAYPYGGRGEVDKREFGILQSFQFKTCLTGRVANVFMEHSQFLHCLPRLIVRQTSNEVDSFRVFLSGMFTALSFRFKKVVSE